MLAAREPPRQSYSIYQFPQHGQRDMNSAIFLVVLCCRVASAQQPPCLTAGYYLSTPTSCNECPAGSYCDAGIKTLCPPGKYQSLCVQSVCLDCPENYACGNGTIDPVTCPEGTVTPSGSASCGTACDYENYYYSANACKRRTVFCDYNTQYEVPTPLNRTTERQCINLKPCNTKRLYDLSPISGNPAGVATFNPLFEYISGYQTRYTDRNCTRWAPCQYDEYVVQLPVDDGMGFLVMPLICKKLSTYTSDTQYRLVDSSITRFVHDVFMDGPFVISNLFRMQGQG
jgi:hypothetical protein